MGTLMSMVLSAIASLSGDKNDEEPVITKSEMDSTYRKFVDDLTSKVFFSNVSKETLVETFEKLSRMEKIVVTFNVIYDFSPADVAELVESTKDSVYSQKHKALEKFKKVYSKK